MGHMKKILALIAFSFLFASNASAREGLVDLTSNSVSCKGISIYQDGYYKVTGRCDGLTYPYETTYNKYVLWGKTAGRGEMVRIAEIDKGYFSGNIANSFEAMYVTAEKNGLVRKASDKQVLSGKVAAFSFDKSQITTAPTTATTIPTTPSTTSKVTTINSSTAGTVIGKIVSSLLVVILVIVGLAIGASLLFRSRGSVSH